MINMGENFYYYFKTCILILIILQIFNTSTNQISILENIYKPTLLTIKFNPFFSPNYQHKQQQKSINIVDLFSHQNGKPQQKTTISNTSNFLQAGPQRQYSSGGDSTISNFKQICYFRMDPKTEIKLNQVDGNICTHLILAFFRIDGNGNLTFGNKETDIPYLNELNQFKIKYPNVKIMISVYNEHEFNGFPRAAIDSDFRQQFARSSIEFLKNYNLDGIDLDWEFPNFPNTFRSREHERIGLTKIVKSLRSAIVENFYDRQVAELNELQTSEAFLQYNQHNITTNNPTPSSSVEPYLLTVAIAGQDTVLRAGYELKQLANLCDWLNVMSYDYYLFKTYTPFTGPNSPLYSIVNSQVPIFNKLSLSWTINKLINEDNIPRNKLVMGIPTYARAYKLMFRNSQPASFTLAVGSKGGQIDDYLNFKEVCDIINKPNTIIEFDIKGRVPYLITDDGYTWISYENTQSVREKVRFILENQLAGYMTWNLNSDNFLSNKTINSNNNHEKKQENESSTYLKSSSQIEPFNSDTTFPLHRAMLNEVLKFSMKTRTNESLAKTIPMINNNHKFSV